MVHDRSALNSWNVLLDCRSVSSVVESKTFFEPRRATPTQKTGPTADVEPAARSGTSQEQKLHNTLSQKLDIRRAVIMARTFVLVIEINVQRYYRRTF